LSEVNELLPSDPFGADADPLLGYNRAWFNLLRVQRYLVPRMSRRLRQIGLEDPVWYEILIEIEKAGADGLGMGALEKRLYLPQYALSRHAQRMEAAGLVQRRPQPGRGRSQILNLTELGTMTQKKVWPLYQAAILEELTPQLSSDDAYSLARLLIRLYP
jgi:DNA-binding MarR family transcriptional regulator